MSDSPINPTLFRADLHSHTHCSDGSMSPTDLIDSAIKHNLQALSITDHDTLNAYSEALPYASKINFKLLGGIELSAFGENCTVHVLGYGIDINNSALLAHCKVVILERIERNQAILAKLKKFNINISHDELIETYPNRVIGRAHIAQIMLQKGYVKNLKKAFTDYLGDKGRCVVPLKSLSVGEAIRLIHNANGKAVLAHPHRIKSRKHLNKIIEAPFDGIEAFYALASNNDEQKILRIATEKEWIVTGGSDFHGSSHPYIKLGCSWAPQETFEMLYALFLKNNRKIIQGFSG